MGFVVERGTVRQFFFLRDLRFSHASNHSTNAPDLICFHRCYTLLAMEKKIDSLFFLHCWNQIWHLVFLAVKIVINNNIIEQVTDFKYLGYRISEYKSDLEDKLQT